MRKYAAKSSSLILLFYSLYASPQVLGVDEQDEIEMVSERIRLSYVDPVRCAQLLNFYGVTIGDSKKPVDIEKLPVVVAVPETDFHETIPDHEKVFPQTETDPINELLLFFDPARDRKSVV